MPRRSLISDPHTQEPGFVTGRDNPLTGDRCVLYDGLVSGFDVKDGRWTLICVGHGTVAAETNKRRAEKMLKEPSLWCDDCKRAHEPVPVPQPRGIPFRLKDATAQEKELRFMARKVKGDPEKAALFERVYGVKPDIFW